MKRATNRILRLPHLLFVLVFFTGCSSVEKRLNTLYRQRIPNSKFVIYEFDYAGSFATSSNYTGVTILDSNTHFSYNKIDRLPSSYFSRIGSIGDLEMIKINFAPRTEGDTSLFPLRIQEVMSSGQKIKVTEYNDTYGTAPETSLSELTFSKAEESADSLKFYEVTNRANNQYFKSQVCFPKGNIKIISDSTNTNILRIQIEEAVIGRGEIYKPPAPFNLVINQPIIGFKTYYFYPKNKTKIISLSDFGIYKSVNSELH